MISKTTSKIILLITLFFIQNSWAIYSHHYDQKLADLLLTDPQQVLRLSTERLKLAQSNDDIKNQLISLLYIANASVYLSNSEQALEVITQGLKLAKANKKASFTSEFLGHLAYQNELNGHYAEAVENANLAIQSAKIANDQRLIGEGLSIRASSSLALENYDSALTDVQSALVIFKKHTDNENISYNYNLLALIYFDIKDYDNSIKYFIESDVFDSTQSPYDKAFLYYNLGSAYFGKNDLVMAAQYFKKSKVFSMELKDESSMAFINYGIAKIKLKEKKYEASEKLIGLALSRFMNDNDYLMVLNSRLILAEIKINTKDYDSTLLNLNKIKGQLDTINTPKTELKYLEMKIKYFLAKENWKEIYPLQNKIKSISTRIFEKDLNKSLSELRVEFDVQFNQEKLKHLQDQNKLQEITIENSKTKQKYLIALILLTLAILGITYLAFINQRKTKRYLFKLSNTDHLTNVSNRRHIMQKLKDYISQSVENKSSFVLIMIDLDLFKNINDTYGHDVGNEVLVYFAQLTQKIMSPHGKVGRIGGEEWLIILPDTSLESVKLKLKKLRKGYKSANSSSIPKDCILSFSSGVVFSNGQYKSYEKMLSDVDNAMYKAKDNGREQDVFV